MKNSERVIVNSLVLYGKIILCMVLSLWSVPIILHALGPSDYGLYHLIAGLITMLAFLKTAMASSVQRYLSIWKGKGDTQKMCAVYNISLLIHGIIALSIVILGLALKPLLFSGFLNIEPDRINAGVFIYYTLLIGMFFTIITIPFDGELNAYENMPVFAAVEILDQALRLGLAFLLTKVSIDRLMLYGIGMAAVHVLNFILKFSYTRIRYKELYPSLALMRNKQLFKEMFGFAGWNTFGALAIAGRGQGISLIVNVFYGTLMNASLGIAHQIKGVTTYFSQTLRKSIHPQLMQSEGRNDRERMLRLAYTSSKFCVLVMGMVSIPLIVEMPYVLTIWLKNIPDYALLFAQMTLLTGLIYQMGSGLMAGILAVGKMKHYQLTISVLYLGILPVIYIFLKLGYSPIILYYCLIGCELAAFAARVLFAKRLMNLPAGYFLCKIVLPVVLILLSTYFTLTGICQIMETGIIRLIINCATTVILAGSMAWLFLLTQVEKQHILHFAVKILPPLKKFIKK